MKYFICTNILNYSPMSLERENMSKKGPTIIIGNIRLSLNCIHVKGTNIITNASCFPNLVFKNSILISYSRLVCLIAI